MAKNSKVTPEALFPLIRMIGKNTVMLDSDLAQLYGVETKVLNQAVKRNIERFPKDFMFKLTRQEWTGLKSQIVTSSLEQPDNQRETDLKSQIVTSSHGGRRTLPYAFTEQGIAMLSSVLDSPRAIEVNIAIMRTFVELRGLMRSNQMLEEKIARLEKKYDGQFKIVFDAIAKLLRDELR